MEKRIMLLVNPRAGKGMTSAKLGEIVYRFTLADYSVATYFTKVNMVPELAKTYGGGYPLLVCVGGDGTLSEVISGLMELPEELRPVVGYIPNGTANDMASTLAMPHEVGDAVDAIFYGDTLPLDVGRFADGYFTYVAAFGAFSSVSYTTSQQAKRALGHFAYVLSGIGELPTIKPRHTIVEYDDGVIEDSFIFGAVTNSTSVAGVMKLNSTDVDLSDGKFEVILIRYPLSFAELFEILTTITSQTYDSENVRLLHTSFVRFTFEEPVAWTRDGENGGEHRQLEITNCQRAVVVVKSNPDRALPPPEGTLWL